MLLFTLQALQVFLYFDTPLLFPPPQPTPPCLALPWPDLFCFFFLLFFDGFSVLCVSHSRGLVEEWSKSRCGAIVIFFFFFFCAHVLRLSGVLIHFRVLKKICVWYQVRSDCCPPTTLWIKARLLLDANQTTVAWHWRDSSFNCHNMCVPQWSFFFFFTLWCGPVFAQGYYKNYGFWLNYPWMTKRVSIWKIWHPSAVTHHFCLFLEYNLSIMTLHWFLLLILFL